MTPAATLCRCGHILECCADCMGWLRENSVRIADSWRWYVTRLDYVYKAGVASANAAEADDLAYYMAGR